MLGLGTQPPTAPATSWVPSAHLGDPSRGAGRELGPSPSSWLCFSLFPLFFQVSPNKGVFFPTQLCSRCDRGRVPALPVASASHHPPGGLRAGPSVSPSSLPCSPSHRAGAKSADGAAGPGAGSLGGAGSSGQQHRVRQPVGRWAARQEPARYEGHAKVAGGFSCSDGRSPQPRFLRPGRKAAAAASSTMNYSGVGTAPWGQAGDPFSLSRSQAGGTSTVRGHGAHMGKSWARRAVPAVPLPAGTAHAPSRGDAGGSRAASPVFTWCQPAAGTSPGSTRHWKSPGPPQHVLHPAAGIARHGPSAEPG